MERTSNIKRIAVVGCGVFGAMVALRLAEDGCDVTVFEREKECLKGASFNNQNRLHLGFHYPRDMTTARQCIQGFDRFRQEFPSCIVSEFPNVYFISKENSLTDARAYGDFCDQLGVNYESVSKGDLPVDVRNVSQGMLCEEVVYDCNLLRSSIMERIHDSGITLMMDSQVDQLKRDGEGYQLSCSNGCVDSFDYVINCSYADINRLTSQLGHDVNLMQYEYTIIPIVQMNTQRVGITIMDGPFMTLLPFGNSDNFLMYHVDYSVIARNDARQLDISWLNPKTSPLKTLDLGQHFSQMREACAHFVPALSNAEMVGVLQGPRMVMAKSDKTDARPSVVQSYESGYCTVFSGKIDHCVWVADEVLNLVRSS